MFLLNFWNVAASCFLNFISYLQISSLLAGDNHLTEDERKSFCQEILDFANQQTENQGKSGFQMHKALAFPEVDREVFFLFGFITLCMTSESTWLFYSEHLWCFWNSQLISDERVINIFILNTRGFLFYLVCFCFCSS